MSMIADDRLHGYHWVVHWYALMRLQALTPQTPTSYHLNHLQRAILRQGNIVTSKPLLSQKPNGM
jgi:hypothetical protein